MNPSAVYTVCFPTNSLGLTIVPEQKGIPGPSPRRTAHDSIQVTVFRLQSLGAAFLLKHHLGTQGRHPSVPHWTQGKETLWQGNPLIPSNKQTPQVYELDCWCEQHQSCDDVRMTLCLGVYKLAPRGATRSVPRSKSWFPTT